MNTFQQARGVLAESAPDRVTIQFPGTDYRLQLAVYQPPRSPVGKKIQGSIRAQARRVDLVRTGGRYIEPLQGTPRRIQGEVLATDAGDNSLLVGAGIPILCKLTDPRQNVTQFKQGDLIAFEVLPGVSFSPAAT